MAMEELTGLDPAEVAKVLELLGMGDASFANINAAFKESFPQERHGSVVIMLRTMLDKPLGLSDNIENVPQTLIVYHLLRQILVAAQNSRRSPVAGLVRATQFHELQRLEVLLRDDARVAESHKYKQNQSSAQGSPNSKKQTAKEVSELDLGRCRMLLKAVLFRQLLGRPDAESVNDLLSTPRAALEAEADSWSGQPQVKHALGDALNEIKSAAESENNLSMGGAASRTILCPTHQDDRSPFPETCSLSPSWSRPRPSALAVLPSELRFLCAPSASSSLVLDTAPYTQEWKTATGLLATARSQALSAAQHQQLVAAASKCAGHFGLTIQAFIDVSEHNPQTAAQLLQSVPQQELYVDALIALPNAAGCLRSEVLLAARGPLQPHQLSSYIKSMVSHIRATPKEQQTDIVSNFAVTLHQLTKKQPLSKSDSDLVAPLLSEFSSTVPDVSSLWSSLIKS